MVNPPIPEDYEHQVIDRGKTIKIVDALSKHRSRSTLK
jgi:hypothetical protein